MRASWRSLLTLLAVTAAGLLACVPGPVRAVGEGGDETEPARRPAPRWREDPEQYRRLKDEWKAFHKLPKEKQAHLKQIDEDLNDEPPAVRSRLWAVLDRYTAWLETLDDKDRRDIESAPDTETRLAVIRSLREREWVSHLARAERDRVEQAAPAERAKLIEELRQQERQRRGEWQTALRTQGEAAPPRVPPEFWQRLRLYQQKSLIPTLPPKERQELFRAMRSSWPDHAQRVTELAAKHPIQVPPSEHQGVTTFADPILPKNYAQQLAARPGREPYRLQGRWPDFALALDGLARRRKVALPDKPLGPCKPEEFVKPVQDFITELRKDQAAAKRLDEAQGKWPDYPFAVMELAREKKRRVPGTFLPGSKEFWDQAKAAQPE